MTDRPSDAAQGPSPFQYSTYTNFTRKIGQNSRPVNIPSDMPIFENYGDTPQYDVESLVKIIGVRSATLWSWDQLINVRPQAERQGLMRYSEKDLIAFTWMRQQLIQGADPNLTALRIRNALLKSRTAGNIHAPKGVWEPMRHTDAAPDLLQEKSAESDELMRQSGVMWNITDTAVSASVGQDYQTLKAQFLEDCARFDTNAISELFDVAFSRFSQLESVCAKFILPAVREITDKWRRDSHYLPEAQFAVMNIRSRLFRYFDMITEHSDSPLAVIACGPSEPHDIEALTLALLLRRARFRVVYLGEKAHLPMLLEKAHILQPDYILLSVSAAPRFRQTAKFLSDAQKNLQMLSTVYVFGSLIPNNPILRNRYRGRYLGASADECAAAVIDLQQQKQK